MRDLNWGNRGAFYAVRFGIEFIGNGIGIGGVGIGAELCVRLNAVVKWSKKRLGGGIIQVFNLALRCLRAF